MGRGRDSVEVYGGNLFNARTAINGKAVDKHTGSILSNSRYACSDYIAIPCNAVSLYQNGGTKNQRAFYDSDKNFIAAEVSVNPVTVPKNAKYIRITSEIDKQDMNNIMLSISSTVLPYEPTMNHNPCPSQLQTDYLAFRYLLTATTQMQTVSNGPVTRLIWHEGVCAEH